MTTPAQVRSQRIDALRLDLLGLRHDLNQHAPYVPLPFTLHPRTA